MRKTTLLIFSCTLISLSSLAVEPVKILGKKLTPLWAQEYVGADLVKMELESLNPVKVDVAVWDLGFERDHITLTEEIEVPEQLNRGRKLRANHGTSVVNIFNGPFGITKQLNLMSLGRVDWDFCYRSYWRQYEDSGRLPKVISNSVGWGEDEIAQVAEKAYQAGTLWFLASGNDYPTPVRDREKNSKAMLIGSFAPSGLTTMDTQIDEALVTLAPGNEELLTIDGSGNVSLFGATSGATPMVAASVVNMLSILPELTPDQVRTIIVKTNFPSVENKLGQTQLPGLFNGYKAFKVVERLLDLCPNGDGACIESHLNKSKLYAFDSGEALSCWSVLFKGKQTQSEILQQMRKKVFLGSSEQGQNLSCAYKLLGFSKNAQFYDFISKAEIDLSMMEKEAKKGIVRGVYPLSYYRYTSKYSSQFHEFIESTSHLSDARKKELLSY